MVVNMLTEKKRRYAMARNTGLSIRLAAIECGCPEKTAAQAGSRYEKDLDVIAAMRRLKLGEKIEAEKREKKPRPPKKPKPQTQLERAMDDDPEPAPYDGKTYDCPMDFLRDVVHNPLEDTKTRMEAAKAWDAGIRGRKSASGKKDAAKYAAKKAANKFAVSKPPLTRVK